MAFSINIEDLLNRRKIESERIEFKKGWNPDKIMRTICAFANDLSNLGGGYILIGVDEENGIAKRPVVGVNLETIDGIQKELNNYCNKISPYYMPRISVEDVDGRKVLGLWVPAGDNRPYEVPENVTSKHSFPKIYIRNEALTQEAKGKALDELKEQSFRIPFDERVNRQASIDDISPLLVQDHLRRAGSSLANKMTTDNLEQILDQMNLYSGPSENKALRNVALMMFCEHPEDFFPYMQIDVVTFPEGKLGNPKNFSEVTFKGPVPQLIYKVLEHLKAVLIREYIVKVKEKAEARRFFNYPYPALEEAIVNSLYHRDYQEREPVEITIEPERLSILSFSGPDRSISEAAIKEGKLLRSRRYRNRRLGDFLKEIDLTEGRSTGIPTIQEELRANGSGLATFETDQDRSYFLIDIPCHPDAIKSLQDNKSQGADLEQLGADLEQLGVDLEQLGVALEQVLQNLSITLQDVDIKRIIGIRHGVVKELSNPLRKELDQQLRVKLGEDWSKILVKTLVPQSRKEIFETLGVKNHSTNANKYLDPLVHGALLAHTEEKKNSSRQKYVITDVGRLLLALMGSLEN